MPTKQDSQPRIIAETVLIANGASASAELDCYGGQLMGVILPSAMTGTTIGLQVSDQSGGTYVALKDGASDLALTSAASKYIYFDPKYTEGIRFAKIVSGSAEGAQRSLIALLKLR